MDNSLIDCMLLLPSAARPIIAFNGLQISASVYIYVDVCHVLGPRGPPGNQDGVRADTCVPSSNSWHTKNQRSTQVDYIVLLRKAYCSSQVSRVCVAAL